MADPYRKVMKPAEAPKLDWWEEEKPTEKELEAYDKIIIALIDAPNLWGIGGVKDPSTLADRFMTERRKRFGRR